MPTLRDSFRRISVGFAVEGVGQDSAKSGGLCFFTGDPVLGATDYEWIGSLTEVPRDVIADETNIGTGAIQASAITFELAYSDTVCTRLEYVRPRPDYYLAGDVAAGSTAFLVTDLDGAGITTLDASVVWFLDEAVLLGTHTSGGMYTGCSRGLWGTPDQAHVDGEFGYSRNPYIKHRRCKLIIYDHDTETEETRAQGFIQAPLETSETGTTLQIRTLSAFGALQTAILNRGARRVRIAGFTYQNASGRILLRGRGTYDIRLHKTGATSPVIPFQAGETLVLGTETGGEILIDSASEAEIGAPSFELDSDETRPTGTGSIRGQVWKDDTYEVFWSDRTFGTSGGPSTAELDKPMHPIHVAMGFATSTDSQTPTTSATTFDAYGGAAGCGIPIAAFDTARIAALVDEDPDLEMDRIGPFAWSGEGIPFFQLTNDIILRPYGFFWCKTENGLISIGRRRLADIADWCSQSANPCKLIDHRSGTGKPRLKRRTRSSNQFSIVTAEIGRLPWREPENVLIKSRDGRAQDSLRRSIFSADAERRYDLRTFLPRGGLGASEADQLELQPGILLNDAATGYYGIPTIGITVLPSRITGADYTIGERVVFDASDIETAWFLDADGNRVKLPDPTASNARPFIGQIERRRYLVKRGVYELDLLLTNWTAGEVARWRAPVAQVNGNVVVDGALDVYTDAFHPDGNDSEYFAVGDIIEAWSLDGGRIASTLATITGIAPSEIELDTDLSASLSGDELIRLANLDDYRNNEAQHIAGCDERVFIFYADADNETGTDGDTADIYA